jgi:peptide/nickel transport system ATP-binding protein
MADSLLSVRGLATAFHTDRGLVHAVDEVSFDVDEGSSLAIVGESGCGKSVTALSIMRLVPEPPGEILSGELLFRGRDLLKLPEKEMRGVRGAQISMIFQEPMTSLNPVYTVGSQIVEAIRIHRRVSRRAARDRAVEMLRLVGIPSAEERVSAYPHQLSGGMRQRVMIAMALSCEPALLIADEPTTALDVTIQAQILDLLRRLQSELKMSVIFITHDLGVVAEFASQVVVMYAGRVVETGTVEKLFAEPLHPYTRGLLKSMPPIGVLHHQGGLRRLPTIEGLVPDPAHLPPGCRFAERCALRAEKPAGWERCTEEEPELVQVPEGRTSRCYFSGAPA